MQAGLGGGEAAGEFQGDGHAVPAQPFGQQGREDSRRGWGDAGLAGDALGGVEGQAAGEVAGGEAEREVVQRQGAIGGAAQAQAGGDLRGEGPEGLGQEGAGG